MSKPFKVHELLTPAEVAELEAFVRADRSRTIDECHDWLLERGFTLSRGAAGNWLAEFKDQLLKERFSRSGELAQAIMGAAKEKGVAHVADAALLQLSQVILEQSLKLESDGTIDSADIVNLTRGLRNVVAGKDQVDDLLARQKLALVEAEKVAAGGANGKAVVNKMREILGIAA